MSRYVWIDAGQEPDLEKLRTHGITRCYFDARDTPVVEVPDYGIGMDRGIYAVESWQTFSPSSFANFLSRSVQLWGGDPYKQLAVHANIELHDPGYLIAFLKAWRKVRPYRETAIVIEGLQGGWFTNDLRLTINRDQNLHVLAEAYTGDMSPIDPDNVRSNLINYGIGRRRAQVMYDAARLNPFWDGCAFTQQRLL